jgi:hypothetical protein
MSLTRQAMYVGVFVKPLLSCKSNITCFCTCVSACMRVYVLARACEFTCPGVRACARVRVRVVLLIQHATHIRHILFSFVASLDPP